MTMKPITLLTMQNTMLWLAIVCGLPATATAAPSRTVSQLGPLKVGAPCPSFGGLNLDNQPLSLNKLLKSGKGAPVSAVVVSFFATWCKVCKEQLPSVERVVKSMSGRGVQGVLIDYAEDPEVAAAFMQAQKFTLPVIPDKFAKISERLGVDKTLPRTFVVDHNGNVSAIFENEGDDFEKALRAKIEVAMAVK
jgi:peroxiredoxin